MARQEFTSSCVSCRVRVSRYSRSLRTSTSGSFSRNKRPSPSLFLSIFPLFDDADNIVHRPWTHCSRRESSAGLRPLLLQPQAAEGDRLLRRARLLRRGFELEEAFPLGER